jgi:hypothetical protein
MSSLSKLINQIKSFNINKADHANQLIKFSGLIYNEWFKIKARYRRKFSSKYFRIFSKYEAEEEIIIGLMGLINEKLINHISKSN